MNPVEEMLEAIEKSDVAAVKSLLALDPSLAGARLATGESAVLLAAHRGQQTILEFLLAANPPLTIYEACAAGRVEIVNEALNQNPSLIGGYSPHGWTPLHMAAFFGHIDLAKFLLSAGADASLPSKDGKTAREMAIESGHDEVAVLLNPPGAIP